MKARRPARPFYNRAGPTGLRLRRGIPSRQSGFGARSGTSEVAAQAALAGGLRYVRTGEPGIQRLRGGRAFRYVDSHGRPVRDANVRERIRKLGIPPAWRDVWICPSSDGHVQAVGRDSAGRKQYRYHPSWRAARDAAKYERMVEFARALPALRERAGDDLLRPGLPREKVIAALVRLLEATLIRVGNQEYVRQNGSFGLTTLWNSHVRVSGSRLEFRFRAKSGRDQALCLRDAQLSRIVRCCRALPGRRLFQYRDARGRPRSLASRDVNAYLREIAGADVTAKDFRTWAATVLAARALRACAQARQPRPAGSVVRAIERVAARLGNTPRICRNSYVHPAVIEAYLDGSLLASLHAGGAARLRRGLPPEEASVLALLARRTRRQHRAIA